ncbi:3227_t:CDS:2, partial [Dentiscutata heterogama]
LNDTCKNKTRVRQELKNEQANFAKTKIQLGNIKVENQQLKKKIKGLENKLAIKEQEYNNLISERNQERDRANMWEKQYYILQDQKKKYQILYKACVKSHSNYKSVKKELERIKKENIELKKEINRVQNEKKQINLKIKKLVKQVVLLVKQMPPQLLSKIIEYLDKLTEAGNNNFYKQRSSIVVQEAYEAQQAIINEKEDDAVLKGQRLP